MARQSLTRIIDTVSHKHGRHVTTKAWTVSHINAHIWQRSWLLCILLPSSMCLISKLQFFACMLHSRPSERGMCPVEMSVMRQWWQTSSRTWVPLQWSPMADSPSLLPQQTLCDWSIQLDNGVIWLSHKFRRIPEREILNSVIVWCSLRFDLEFWDLLKCQKLLQTHKYQFVSVCCLLSLQNSKGLKLPSPKFTAFSSQAFMGIFIRITCPNSVACCLTLSQQQRCQL